ncbi:GTPase IMAP family member 4-like [Xiphophorus maculatus]|uniref:GTPase IMAP family member 4-like n=1 Tax=Xiphophorus maculatus TaxID=8083 RepID=UPI000293C75D|nr:GTPase IMAP family member 4-like [Xiphophorus maculatus]XP_023181018.1 GTPase IMAP family member 4-like [Xiphophorus maculatus]XP_023181024.1 GTPase IMAP family member 4-like [Xiphophorus maculatus]
MFKRVEGNCNLEFSGYTASMDLSPTFAILGASDQERTSVIEQLVGGRNSSGSSADGTANPVLRMECPDSRSLGITERYRTAKEKTKLRIVLLGKTGVGKSSSVNTILGRKACMAESHSSLTSSYNFCYESHDLNHDLSLTVIDTPGLFQTHKSNEEILGEIGKSINMAAPGPHVFLIVLQLIRFTPEDKETMEIIKKLFGEEAARYTMILFTQGDALKMVNIKIEDLLEKSEPLKRLINQCSSLEKFEEKYHVFDNNVKDPAQVSGLLQKINRLVKENGGRCYTNEMFEEAQREKQEEIKQHLRAVREKRCVLQ